MSGKTTEPTIMGPEPPAQHAASEISKMSIGATGVVRRKRGPAGRETTHPIGISYPQRNVPQSSQSAPLNVQRAQISPQKSPGNFVDLNVPLQAGLNRSSGNSAIAKSTESPPKMIQTTTANAATKA